MKVLYSTLPLKLIPIALLLLLGPFSKEAQTPDIIELDRIYLKTGSVITGKILEIDDASILFERRDGSLQIRYPAELVDRYEIGIVFERPRREPYKFRAEWFYIEGGIATLSRGSNGTWGANPSWGVQLTAGYQKFRWLGIGLTAGRYDFNPWGNLVLYPLGLEARGYFSDRKLSPFYKINFGYSIPGIIDRSKDENRFKPKGGFFVKPSLGFNWVLGDVAFISAEMGILLGRATEYHWQAKNKYLLKRWSGTIGVGAYIGENKNEN